MDVQPAAAIALEEGLDVGIRPHLPDRRKKTLLAGWRPKRAYAAVPERYGLL